MTRRRTCDRHREALVAFVGRRETGPGTAAALEHLEGCPSCADATEAIARSVHALRRLGREAAAAEPDAGAWERLRRHVDRPRVSPWQVRATVAGLAVAAGLVGVLVGPATMTVPRVTYLQEIGTEPAAFDALRLAEARAENAIIDWQRATRVALPASASTTSPAAGSAAGSGWAGPDGIGVVDTNRAAAAPARSS